MHSLAFGETKHCNPTTRFLKTVDKISSKPKTCNIPYPAFACRTILPSNAIQRRPTFAALLFLKSKTEKMAQNPETNCLEFSPVSRSCFWRCPAKHRQGSVAPRWHAFVFHGRGWLLQQASVLWFLPFCGGRTSFSESQDEETLDGNFWPVI